MELRVGTSGYSYPEWKGAFYPDAIEPAEMLAFYASRLGAVELNNTFYRLPKREVVEAWASQVPDAFRFALKASRRITHIKRLATGDGALEYLLATTAALGARRGPLLFQLPPNAKANRERLATFLAALPGDVRAAFEFRHDSWRDDAVFELLRAHNAAWVTADAPDDGRGHADDGAGNPPIIATADWGYLRLRRIDYTADDLARWRAAIEARPWRCAYVFFKHEDDAAGPLLAEKFA